MIPIFMDESIEQDARKLPDIAPSRKAHEEYQYLDLIRRILEEGEHRPDR